MSRKQCISILWSIENWLIFLFNYLFFPKIREMSANAKLYFFFRERWKSAEDDDDFDSSFFSQWNFFFSQLRISLYRNQKFDVLSKNLIQHIKVILGTLNCLLQKYNELSSYPFVFSLCHLILSTVQYSYCNKKN